MKLNVKRNEFSQTCKHIVYSSLLIILFIREKHLELLSNVHATSHVRLFPSSTLNSVFIYFMSVWFNDDDAHHHFVKKIGNRNEPSNKQTQKEFMWPRLTLYGWIYIIFEEHGNLTSKSLHIIAGPFPHYFQIQFVLLGITVISWPIYVCVYRYVIYKLVTMNWVYWQPPIVMVESVGSDCIV